MKEFYLWSFAFAGLLWLSCPTSCFFGVRAAMQRSAISIRKALTLGVLPLVVSVLGSRIFKLHFHYASQTTVEGSPRILNSSHWHIESWWFFRFSEVIAVVSTLVAVVVWFSLR